MLLHNLFLYWKPVTEIIILWPVIYHILLFSVGTRALQALKGIIILLLAYFIFHKFDFYVLNKLYKELFGISVLAVLIIFHAEIRQGLANRRRFKLYD